MKITNEVKIGLVVLSALVILFFGLNFLKGRNVFSSDNTYYSQYSKISGLKVSSPVEYRGYQVGQVSDIRFTGKRSDVVLVEFTVSDDIKLPADSRAEIFSQDLMGTKAINIKAGDAEVYLKSNDTLAGSVEKDLKEQVGRQIMPLKNKAEKMLASMDSVLTVLQYIFTDETKNNIKNSLSSVRRTLNNVENASFSLDSLVKREGGRLDKIFYNVESVSSNLEKNNESVSKLITNFSAISDSIASVNLAESIRRADSAVCVINTILGKMKNDEGTAGAIINNRELYNNLNETVVSLNTLISEVKENPKRFVNVSLIDFGGKSGNEKKAYVLVLKETDKRLDRNNEIFREKYTVEEYFYNGKYLYIYDMYKREKTALKKLSEIKKKIPTAFVIKL